MFRETDGHAAHAAHDYVAGLREHFRRRVEDPSVIMRPAAVTASAQGTVACRLDEMPNARSVAHVIRRIPELTGCGGVDFAAPDCPFGGVIAIRQQYVAS